MSNEQQSTKMNGASDPQQSESSKPAITGGRRSNKDELLQQGSAATLANLSSVDRSSVRDKEISNSIQAAAAAAVTVPPNVANGSDFEVRLKEQAVEISAQDRRDMRTDTVNYDAQRMIGHGSFGAVFFAKVVETNEIVAIKKVLQDKRFKNRELQIMRQLAKQPHPYVVTLRNHFISKGSKNDDVFLNLVLEYIPETMHSVAKSYNKAREQIPISHVRIYMYQLARALAHIHGLGICHRDVKPQNLLVDPSRFVLKLCDFGSAKALVKGEPNIAYICSRYYRAPELIFGSTDYTWAVDVWSQGCVMAELLIGSPLFPGASGVDQLVEIIKVLGTPTREQLKHMNPNYQEFKFPQIRAQPWANLFKPGTPPDAKDLLQIMLAYTPQQRCKAIEACTHVFFNELRVPTATLPDNSPMPVSMFTFTAEELTLNPEVVEVLIPPHIGPTPAMSGGGMRAYTTPSTSSSSSTASLPAQNSSVVLGSGAGGGGSVEATTAELAAMSLNNNVNGNSSSNGVPPGDNSSQQNPGNV